MASRISPYIDNTGLVFAYDLANVNRSYLGEPTVNLHPNPEDVSSWTGNLFNNWINSAVTSNASIAPNGTLTADRLGNGYGRFNASVSITAGQTYTYSVYLKNVNLTNGFGIVYAWGLNGSLVSYGTAYNVSIAEISTGEWTRVTTTITAPGSGVNQVQFGPCPFTGYGNPSGQQLDVWGGHIENKSHATPYVNGTRSATQGLIDLTGNSTIDLTNVSFDSNAQMTFDGTNDFASLSTGILTGTGDFTVEAVVQADASEAGGTVFGNYPSGNLQVFFGQRFIGMWLNNASTYLGTSPWSVTLPEFTTQPVHIVAQREGTTTRLYLNAVLKKTGSSSNTIGDSSAAFRVGANTSGTEELSGTVYSVRVFTRALPASEIQQNFNAIKGRYGL